MSQNVQISLKKKNRPFKNVYLKYKETCNTKMKTSPDLMNAVFFFFFFYKWQKPVSLNYIRMVP